MSDYLIVVAFLVGMFFPLWIPIAITVAPFVSNSMRRVRRAIT